MKYNLNTIILVVLLFLTGCTDNMAEPAGKVLMDKGKGSFVFQNEDLISGLSLTVWTYLPSNYSADSAVLFVIHGNGRTAERYRNAWVDIAERQNALLLVPHFTREQFPLDSQYHQGNMFKTDSADKILSSIPENEWTFSVIDPIFDLVVAKMRNKSESYFIYGHSAGSQFVHRFLFFKPDAKVKKVVCANAGWYTMPDFNEFYPYGLKGTKCNKKDLRKLFGRKVTVLLGEQDTDTAHSSLRRTPQAMKQGAHRFERGHTFYRSCKQMADSLKAEFTWYLQLVPGVAHSNKGMSKGAEEVFFGEK
jgi:hypothetical protein